MTNLKDDVAREILSLNSKERKRSVGEIASLIAMRLTKGWAFRGEKLENHTAEVAEIRKEVFSQLEGL